MDKIQILTTCKACSGATYLATSITAENGNRHTTYQPCYACRGSGVQLVWLDLREFSHLLNAIAAETMSKHVKTRQNHPKNKEFK